MTEATSNVSPYVTIFGGEVTYKNTITLEERTVNEDGNIWIGIILIVVFIIAVFIMMCFINYLPWSLQLALLDSSPRQRFGFGAGLGTQAHACIWRGYMHTVLVLHVHFLKSLSLIISICMSMRGLLGCN